MKKVAIILARGGSKRIPNKNIKPFLDRPIISYSIKAAINSQLFDEVIVSTDCEKIKKVSESYGAKVPFLRSSINSNDNATTVDALFEVLDFYKSKNKIFHFATCIYACAPFITSHLLIKSYEILKTNNSDSVFPVIAYSHPIQRALKIIDKNKITVVDELKSNTRTQDLISSYYDSGMFYSFDINKLYKNKNLRTNNSHCIEIDELHGQDIDNTNDWALAELKYKLMTNE
jgi:pseudaminic acid cytidylyltransferase